MERVDAEARGLVRQGVGKVGVAALLEGFTMLRIGHHRVDHRLHVFLRGLRTIKITQPAVHADGRGAVRLQVNV